MSTERSITVSVPLTEAKAIESFVTRGDWSQLAPQDRARAYAQVCAQHGLNPMSQPFAFLRLNGKEVLYATRGATDQLAAIHRVTREIIDGPKIVDISGTKVALCVARASHPNGRFETATATLPVADPVNLYMKLETKAKRRATIALLGLAMLDETELATIPDHARGEASQPMRADIEQAVAEAEVAARGEPVQLADLGIETRQLPETLPAPADATDVLGDIEVQVCRCGTVGALADLWIAAREDVATLPSGAKKRAWALVGQRATAIGSSAALVRAEVERRDTPTPPTPTGSDPSPAQGTTDASGESVATTPATGAQASTTAWRESREGITAHVAKLGARHIENSGRAHLRDVPEALRLHALHAYASRYQRLSHDGTSALAADECMARAERWLREGPVVAKLAAQSTTAKRAAGRSENRAEIAQREADAWNARHPVGTVVRYWRGLREGEPSGEGAVRHPAQEVCGTASVWVTGCSGCVAISHVEATAKRAAGGAA